MEDMLEAKHVELLVDPSGKVWLNVDGRCVFRCGLAENIIIEDNRKSDFMVTYEVGHTTDETNFEVEHYYQLDKAVKCYLNRKNKSGGDCQDVELWRKVKVDD